MYEKSQQEQVQGRAHRHRNFCQHRHLVYIKPRQQYAAQELKKQGVGKNAHPEGAEVQRFKNAVLIGVHAQALARVPLQQPDDAQHQCRHHQPALAWRGPQR